MGILYDLSTKYKAISIVGMAKNAGKTTALNYLIEEAIDEGMMQLSFGRLHRRIW